MLGVARVGALGVVLAVATLAMCAPATRAATRPIDVARPGEQLLDYAAAGGNHLAVLRSAAGSRLCRSSAACRAVVVMWSAPMAANTAWKRCERSRP